MSPSPYKVVLIFDLKPGMADEELRRSRQDGSFPRRLSAQPGFMKMELVKVTDQRTMSLQTWSSAEDWWAALETVKSEADRDSNEEKRETILVSREFVAGSVAETLVSAGVGS
jgi:heme-degrading monooxygenase HmoA